MRRSLSIMAVAAALACGGGPPEPEAPEPERTRPGPSAERRPSPPDPPQVGGAGLWPREAAGEQRRVLAERGAEIEAGVVEDLAGATVRVGSCAGAFISEEGLVVTARECVRQTLLRHDESLEVDGFLASERASEIQSGPELAMRVLLGDEDVTDQVREGLEAIDGDVARGAHIEARRKELANGCRSQHVDCEVVAERGGASFRKLRFLVIPDVRIAYAPPRDVASVQPADRGRWPRPAAGAALVRPYVGSAGAPSPPAPENEPFRAGRALPLAGGARGEGEPVVMAGFPGRTFRDEPLGAFEQELSWRAPRRVRRLESLHDAVHRVLRDDPASPVARHRTRELAVRLRRAKGALAGLEAGAERRRAAWRELRASRADEQGEGSGSRPLSVLEDAHERRWQSRQRDVSIADLEESAFFRVARAIVRAAAENPDEEGGETWKRKRRAPIVFDMPEGDHPAVDRAVLGTTFERAARWANINRGWLRDALDMATFDRELVQDTIDRFYARTELGDPVVRERLFADATLTELEESEDPFLRMALALAPRFESIETRRRRYLGARAAEAPAYHRLLASFRDAPRAPDANGSLRLSFGRIRAYSPDPEEPAKPAVVAAPEEGDASAFIASTDAAGGFAGAPAVNGSGQLMGVALERVYEALGSEWILLPSMNRTIYLDARYLVALLREAGADALLRELDLRGAASNVMTPPSD